MFNRHRHRLILSQRVLSQQFFDELQYARNSERRPYDYDFLTEQYPELAAKIKVLIRPNKEDEEGTYSFLQNGVTEDEFHGLFPGVEKVYVEEFWDTDMIVPV